MIIDKQNLCSDMQNLAQAAGNYVSTDAIDLWGQTSIPTIPGLGGSVVKDIGRGFELEAFCQVTETFTSGGAATLQAQIIGATASDLTTGQVIYQETAVIALATLVAGYQFRLSTPVGITLRFLGYRFVIGTAAMTGGKCTAGFTVRRQSNPFVG